MDSFIDTSNSKFVDDRPLVIAIVGPTASGKSAVGIELAKRIDGEIISADSMQVYVGMDIGTAKVTASEMDGIPHHMVDICEPDTPFNVSQYQVLAEEKINEILEKGKTPIVVGGTGLYIDALLSGFMFPDVTKNESIRSELEAEGDQLGSAALHERLKTVDPAAALKLHPNDMRRIIRALEVYISTGKPITTLQKEHKAELKYRSKYYGLYVDREEIRKRIDIRVDKMMNEGLLNEVTSLVSKGYLNCIISMQAIGYKELVLYIRGEISLLEATELIKTETKKYAKRQMTWFKKNKDIYWIDVNDNKSAKEHAKEISDDLIM